MQTPTPVTGHYNNLPLLRFDTKSLKIEGFSRGGMQTYWRVRECDLLLDIGACHWDLAGSRFAAITHAHPDHFAGLIGYIATREMMNYPPPTVFVPDFLAPHVRQLVETWRSITGDDYPHDLIAIKTGSRYPITGGYLLEAVAADHTVAAVSYIVWHQRSHLKPKFQGLTDAEIKQQIAAGAAVKEDHLAAVLAYTGDSRITTIDAHESMRTAEVLISECTFVGAEVPPAKAREHGHTHLDELAERADQLKNNQLILGHFSTRWRTEQVIEALNSGLPESLHQKTIAWI